MLEALDEPLHIPKPDLLLWLFLAAICGGAIYGSAKASQALERKYDANAKKIAAAEKSVAKAAKADKGSLRPNAALVKDVDTRREARNKQLLQLWQSLYDRQAALAVWPKEAGIVLNTPPDAGKKKGKKADIPEQTCKFYNDDVVRAEFERIFSKLDVRRPKAGQRASLENLPFKDQPADFDGLVAWDPQRREAIVARHYLAEGTPSSARVKLVQEDLWIFESLVDALASLNRNAKDALTAPVKQIDVLDVAQWATVAHLQHPPAMWKPEAADGATPAAAAAPTLPTAPGPDATDEALSHGRYLDDKGQPLAAGAPQPFAEFKQIFVYMKLVIDQRRFPDLLTALANASLPVEVRDVAVQVLPDPTVRQVTPADGESVAPVPVAGVPIGSLSIAETTAWDASVEIGGVIYLYNEPNAKKLGSGAVKSPKRTFRIP